MEKLSIRDLEMSGKRVFIRVDFNVPLSDSAPWQVTDDTRIRETIPTLKLARERGAQARAGLAPWPPKREAKRKI